METEATKVDRKDLIKASTDFVFKRLFGAESHKRVLVCLLNAILKGNPQIESLELDNTELCKDIDGGKNARLDIKAKTPEGTLINIEMQCSDKGNLLNRSAFYQSRMMPQEIGEGDSYDSVPKMIFIWIAADHKPTKRKHHTHEAVQMFKDNGIDPIEIASDKFRTFIIELEKIEFKRVHHADMFSVWMMFIKHPELIPDEFLAIPEVNEAMKELSYLSHDKQFREEYEARQRLINDANAEKTIALKNAREQGLDEGREQGKAEGLEEGMEKGKQEEKHAIAKSMKAKGLDLKTIAECTGLSKEDIQAL